MKRNILFEPWMTEMIRTLTNMYKLSVDAAGRDRRTVLFPDTAE